MKVFIPTYKRAGDVLTRKTLDGGILVCHEFEEKDYREKEGGEIMVVPDDLRGNIAKVRNFILENAGSDRIVMMDDDISEIGYHEDMSRISMTAEEIWSCPIWIPPRIALIYDKKPFLWAFYDLSLQKCGVKIRFVATSNPPRRQRLPSRRDGCSPFSPAASSAL